MVKTNLSYDEIASSHLWFLRLLGLVPLQGKSLDSFVTKLLLGWFNLMTTLSNSMWTGYGVRMVANKKFEVDFICELMVIEGTHLRYLLLSISREKLVQIMNMCNELWTHVTKDERYVVRNFERKAFHLRTFMLINVLSVTTSFVITSHFVRIPKASINDTDRKVLPFRFYVEVYEEPWFTPVMILQEVVAYAMAFIVIGVETVGLYLILMSCGYMRVVRNRLLKLQNPSKHSDSSRNLSDEVVCCARLHQRVLLFCEGIKNTTKNIFFVTVLTTIYNMSITGLKLLENDEDVFKFITIFTMNLFQFFIVQWSPEYLLNESEAIGDMAYFATMKHSRYEPKFNKVLLIMMIRAQRPFQLTAGDYINLSMETFGNMVRSAFSFFAVLRNFKPQLTIELE